MTTAPYAKPARPISASFEAVAEDGTVKKRPAPFSIRLSSDERRLLEDRAGNKPLGWYIRSVVLGDMTPKRRCHRVVKRDHTALGKVLAALGQSRLASNLNQIAKAANIGALPVTPELEHDLAEACSAIKAMRRDLIEALGLKS